MKGDNARPLGFVLPLPRFVLQPLTAFVVAAVHVYLAAGHLSQLIGGDVQWEHFWKGFGALGGAYVFAALASLGLAATRSPARSATPPSWPRDEEVLDRRSMPLDVRNEASGQRAEA